MAYDGGLEHGSGAGSLIDQRHHHHHHQQQPIIHVPAQYHHTTPHTTTTTHRFHDTKTSSSPASQQVYQTIPHQFNTTSSQTLSNVLAFRNHQTSHQYLSPATSEADVARLSQSPASTIESSPATSTLDFDQTPDYYMQRIPQQNLQSSQQDSRHSSLDTAALQQAYWPQQSRSASAAHRIRTSISNLHKRTNSDSTIQSSPYTPTTYSQNFQQPYIVDPETHQFSVQQQFLDQQHSQSVTSIPKSYPQSTQPIDHSVFYAPDYQATWHNDASQQQQWMNQAFLQQQQSQASQFSRQTYRTMEPPRETTPSGQEKQQQYTLETIRGLGPRTVSAIYEDELYNPVEPTVPAIQRSTPAPPKIVADGTATSAVNSVLGRSLQAANQSHLEARSASPTTTSFEGSRSPFRPRSTITAGYEPPTSPVPRMTTAASLREQANTEAAVNALAAATRRASRESSQTVSPKEVSLEYEAPEKEEQGAMFGSLTPPRPGQYKVRPSRLQQELTRSTTYENLLNREASSNVSNESTTSMTSAGSQPLQVPQQYPFIRTARPSAPLGIESSQESNPQFPARLISMESTRSEHQSSGSASAGVSFKTEPSQDGQDQEETSEQEVERPSKIRADGGTYTCTYHGCTQRFDTPQKLQKHKKEGHRQGTPSSNPDARMTQAGPHKCERINPQTGKPCNSVFSRPYDLTRHEDTIHNGKKQKVRCQICIEDKLFSRNDALTRHMRVVHPDVDFNPKKRASR